MYAVPQMSMVVNGMCLVLGDFKPNNDFILCSSAIAFPSNHFLAFRDGDVYLKTLQVGINV